MMLIGEMIKQWLTKLEWYSTLFPRIPVPVQKDIDQRMRELNASKLPPPPPEPVKDPQHIRDEDLNFGEAEKYATNAAGRKRSVGGSLAQDKHNKNIMVTPYSNHPI